MSRRAGYEGCESTILVSSKFLVLLESVCRVKAGKAIVLGIRCIPSLDHISRGRVGGLCPDLASIALSARAGVAVVHVANSRSLRSTR